MDKEEMKVAINSIKPTIGQNSKDIKYLIDELNSKLNKSLNNGKTYTILDNSFVSDLTAVLDTFRTDMILSIMRLEKCDSEPLNAILGDDIETERLKHIKRINNLTLRVHWLEKYCEKILGRSLSVKYYGTDTKELPKI